MFKKMSVSLKLFLGFSMVLILILILGIYIITDLMRTSELREENANINNAVARFLIAENGHYQWMSDVKDYIYKEDITDLQVNLDFRKCELGQFIYSEEINNILGRYENVMTLIEEIKTPHQELHQSAEKIEKAQSQQAMIDIFDNETFKSMNKVQGILSQIRSILQTRSVEIETELQEKGRASLTMTLILAGLSVFLGVLVSIIISRSILNTLGGEPYFLANVVDKVSDGELDINWGRKSSRAKGLLLDMMKMVESLLSKANSIEQISDGDFDVDVTLASNRDVMGKAMIKMADSLQTKSNLIKKISDGDFTVDVNLISDKDKVGKSLSDMVESLNIIFEQINQTAEDVKSGAKQLSNSSQDLSEGASDQASSLEEVSASLSQISSQVQGNTENVVKASELAETVKDNAQKGNDKMQDFVKAIQEINNSAEEIRNIVKIIDDIAFQTNLLALNANIEAARVGKYGKGFAVVANSVRSLATESAESVKETTEQVEKVIKNIEIGSKMANDTAEYFKDIVDKSIIVNNLVSEVATASQEQSRGIEQISTALNQVENIVQSNTANAEENASTSEQLSQQAERLSDILSKFKFGNRQGKKMLTGSTDIHNLSPEMLNRIAEELKREGNDEDNQYNEKDVKPLDDEF